MKNIAIITARGGSKRIPKKNIRDFCGKPILAYSIEAAIESGIFDEVMVSTDDPEIADAAKAYGANIPFFRSEKTSDDFATTSDVLLEVLMMYKAQGRSFDHLCCLYPTAPFITAEKLQKAWNMLRESVGDCVFPVVRFSFPPQRGVVLDGNGYIRMAFPEHLNSRSQDLEPMYHDCGQFYFCRTEAFLEQGKLMMEKTIPIIMPESEVQDIDTLEDWKIAEMKYRIMRGGEI